MDQHEPTANSGPEKRQQWIELLLFIFVIMPGVLVASLALRPPELTFTSIAIHTIFVNLVLLGIVVALVRRAGEPVGVLGLRSPDGWAREVLAGVLLFIPFTLLAAVVEAVVRAAGLTGPEVAPQFLIPIGPLEMVLALAFLVAVSVGEETVFRGYLIHRMMGVSGSAAIAVVGSALIFAIGHGYQGPAGVATVGVMGVVLALIYLWRGSLIAPIVIHFMQNFVGIIIAPMFPEAGG